LKDTRRFAYLLSCFPALSETFVLNEVKEIEGMGECLDFYSYKHPGKKDLENPRSKTFRNRVVYGGAYLAPRLLLGVVVALITRPLVMISILFKTFSHNLTNPIALIKCIVLLPKTVFFAKDMHAKGVSRLHCHFGTFPAYGAWVCKKLYGIPYSFTVHAHDIYDFQDMLKVKIDEAVKIVCNSQFNINFLRNLYPGLPQDKLVLIRTGIHLDNFLTEIPDTNRRDKNKTLQVLAVGRIDPTKGYGDMIKIISKLREKGYNLRADVVGHITKEKYVLEEVETLKKALEKSGIEEYFSFHERLSFEELLNHYHSADLFLLPCVTTPEGNSDGLPSVLVEAMAAGKAVVSTTISGIPELIINGETGLICPEGDIDGLTNACTKFLDEPEYALMLARAGQKRVREQWDIRITSKQMNKIIKNT
jgi:colanic acid/amylovoran biosynthesis glycosyltransferase